MRNHHCGSVFGAFVGGAIIGGVVALLLAPRSGAETRGMIRDFVDDEMDMVKDKAAAARDYAMDEIGKYKRKARRAVSQIEDMVDGVKDCVEQEREKLATR